MTFTLSYQHTQEPHIKDDLRNGGNVVTFQFGGTQPLVDMRYSFTPIPDEVTCPSNILYR